MREAAQTGAQGKSERAATSAALLRDAHRAVEKEALHTRRPDRHQTDGPGVMRCFSRRPLLALVLARPLQWRSHACRSHSWVFDGNPARRHDWWRAAAPKISPIQRHPVLRLLTASPPTPPLARASQSLTSPPPGPKPPRGFCSKQNRCRDPGDLRPAGWPSFWKSRPLQALPAK